ncbi:MAG TPA: MarR family transcriptional regulator [Cyanobacteria bacterium UBA8530]|nr:MarR family transcriptional regulator [Cyanobacteria bacterium UBA8530]
MRIKERLEAQAEIFGSVFLLSLHLAHRTDVAMSTLDVTTKQWLLLVILVKKFSGQDPTLSEAARWYGASRQNVKQIARQLEDRGYLRLVPDPKDRRALLLQLTEKVRVFDEPDERIRQASLMNELFFGFTENDLQCLRTLMSRWLTALTPAEPDREGMEE